LKCKMKSLILLALALTAVLFAGTVVFAANSRVVTLGADLTKPQRTMIASEFNINLGENNTPVIEVTNQEERKYLEGLVPDDVIGNRAISSALVEILPAGQGIKVQAKNITWVTDNMYANALATAKVKDARVLISAPFPVSGTAALTGIFKGFEIATGSTLGESNKKIANEELVRTGELGQEIGKDKAAELILLVKEKIAAEGTRDPARIKQIIINVAGDLNINLDNRQIDDITSLMERISGLNLQAKDLTSQLSGIKGTVERAIGEGEQIKNWLQRIMEALNQLIEQIKSLILG
jgi:uncharacterized protein YpuA (DUF1002 family)